MSKEIKVGDIVQLKSGGPLMTISSGDVGNPEIVACVSFVGENYFHKIFNVNTLKLVKPEEEYNEVELDISDKTFLKIAKLAHEKNITFNEMCNELLKEYLKEKESEETECFGESLLCD